MCVQLTFTEISETGVTEILAKTFKINVLANNLCQTTVVFFSSLIVSMIQNGKKLNREKRMRYFLIIYNVLVCLLFFNSPRTFFILVYVAWHKAGEMFAVKYSCVKIFCPIDQIRTFKFRYVTSPS